MSTPAASVPGSPDVTRPQVHPAQWLASIGELLAAGHTYFDFLAATDLGDGSSEVVVHLMCPDASGRVLAKTVVDDGTELASLVELYPAAAWHEREAHEFVGIDFAGHPDLRPLLLAPTSREPLRRSTPLAARLGTTWPGLADPGVDPDSPGRRRARQVPGVSRDWLRPAQEIQVGADE